MTAKDDLNILRAYVAQIEKDNAALRSRVAELEEALRRALKLCIRCGCDKEYSVFVELSAIAQESGK